MKVIAPTSDLRESQLLAGAEVAATLSDDGFRGQAAVDQLQQSDAPGLGITMLFPTEQVAEGGGRVDPHQDRIGGLEDLVVAADRTADRSYCWLNQRAWGMVLRTMLWTVPRDIGESNRAPSSSTTPR
jgi:hypothetical protein